MFDYDHVDEVGTVVCDECDFPMTIGAPFDTIRSMIRNEGWSEEADYEKDLTYHYCPACTRLQEDDAQDILPLL